MLISHENLILIAYAQMLILNVHADVSKEASGLNIDVILHPHLYFVYASSECSGESQYMPLLLADAISTEISCSNYICYMTGENPVS